MCATSSIPLIPLVDIGNFMSSVITQLQLHGFPAQHVCFHLALHWIIGVIEARP